MKNFLPNATNSNTEVKAKLQEIKTPKQEIQNSEWQGTSSVVTPKEANQEKPKNKVDTSNSNEFNKIPKESSGTTEVAKAPQKIYLTFDDIIRCADLIKNKKSAAPNNPTTENAKSALTYIILPSLGIGSPC